MRRRLGRELLALRTSSKKTAKAVAQAADLAESSVTRIEKATLAVRVNTIKAIVDVYDPPPDRRAAVLELARAANSDTWWHAYAGGTLPKWFEVYVDLEAEASELSIFDPQYINGLVQTEDYARALYLAGRPDESDEEIERLVAVRMARQKRLVDGKMSLKLILDQWALRREFGSPDITRAQLERLLELGQLRRATIQVLPNRNQPGIMGGFTILEFEDECDLPVVYTESEAGGLYQEKPVQIRQYARAYGRLQTAALDPEASANHIAQVIKEL